MAGNLWEQAQEMYPYIAGDPVMYKESFGKGEGRYLEHWPANEEGDESSPRPKEFPIDKVGLEIYDPKTKPSDLAADYVSHSLVNTDPELKKYYAQFQETLKEPGARKRLAEQYGHAVNNEGESRDYNTWLQSTGIPAYFRGYTFNQWPDEFNQQAYTGKQKKLLDEVKAYLSKPKKSKE